MSLITTNIDRAIQDLKSGCPVALPTETVYGLAAMISRVDAIRQIFELKNRPLNHPLIVHVAQDFDISELTDSIPDYAKLLIKHFWPGPLTLIFKCRKDTVNPLITGGQSTIAIRCPSHSLTQRVLRKLKTPLVMPSANVFGKISPTTAQHVKQSFSDKDVLILDGGRCSVGIESTIVDVTNPYSAQILRHGLIDENEIAKIIPTHHSSQGNSIRAPGTLDSHYQPKKNLYYFEHKELIDKFCQRREDDVFVIAYVKPLSVSDDNFYPLAKTPAQVAYDLYYQLRKADASRAICISIQLPPNTPEYYGVRERILKAGHPYSQE